MLERPKRSQCPIALLSIRESFWRSFGCLFWRIFLRVFLRVSKVELTLEEDSKGQSWRFRESKLWIAFQFESWRQFETRKSDKRLEGSAILKLRFSILQKNFCSSAFVMLTLGRAYLTPPKFGSLSLESKLWTHHLTEKLSRLNLDLQAQRSSPLSRLKPPFIGASKMHLRCIFIRENSIREHLVRETLY